jgi:predicted nucleic acid-binding protein
LVLDANIMVAAAAGTGFPLLLRLFEAGVDMMASVHQWAETRHILLQEIGAPSDWVDGRMADLATVVRPLHPALIEDHRDRALSRLRATGRPDWPVLATAYAADAAIWSHDKDLWGTGAAIWFTRTLRSEMDLQDHA